MTLVVPYAAGATTDTLARAVGELIAKRLGVPVIVDNKAGANGIIGASFVSRSPADGYTVLLSSDSSNVLNPLLYSKLPYDPDRDLKPLSLLSDLPVILVVDAKLPIKNVAEFVAYAKANPGTLNYGSTGSGGTFHLAGELFSQQAGIKMTHVPYKGGAPAVAGLLGGQVQALFGVIGSNLQHIRAGTLRSLALAARQRMQLLPDVPTFAEAGYPDFVVLIRYGLSVPVATPAPQVARLNEAVQAPEAGDLERLWNLRPVLNPFPRREVFPRAPGPFIRAARGDEPARELVVGTWGLIPWFAKTSKVTYSTNNARSEELAAKATFKLPWQRGQRCIIPADSFDEPNWESGKNVWWRFRRSDGTPWGLAGLWNTWTDKATGEIVESYTMLTMNADAHDLMRRMHKPDPKLQAHEQDKRSVVPIALADVDQWLHGTQAEAKVLIELPAVELFDAGPMPR